MRCGTGRRVINPEPGHHLSGYGTEYPNDGVHDDLTVTALYLESEERAAALLNFDLIGMRGAFNAKLRAAVARRISLKPGEVFLTNTHTHSGPEVRVRYQAGGKDLTRPDYNRRLIKWAAEAAADARAAAEPCTLHYNFAFAQENMNRRYSLPDRRFLYVPQHKQLAGLSPEYVDRELGLVAFKKKGTPNRYLAVITNYTCHPLCVGNSSNLVSADFPGALRYTVEETFAGCRCLATTGAAGDNHPLSPEAGFSAAEKTGAALGRLAIARLYDAVEVAYDTRLRLAYRRITLPTKDDHTARLLPEEEDRRRPSWMRQEGVTVFRTCYGLLGIGPLLFVAVPGELVAELGAALKWSSPFLKTYVLYQATDNAGYIIAANQYLWGGYEGATCALARGSGELLVRKILDGAGKLLEKEPLILPPRPPAKVDY